MKEIILTTKFVEVSFDDETKIYVSKYLPETKDMTDAEWKKQMMDLKILIEKYKPTYLIDDNRDRLYSYSPDMQVWTLNLFVDSWNKIGLKKYAQIMPKEIVGKLASEQIEDFAVNEFKMKYEHKLVNDLKSAQDWIKEAN